MLSLLTLDEKGIALACVFGVLIFFLGQNYGALFLADLLVFLAISAVVTQVGKGRKEGIGMYEHARGWKNVLSNGLVPLIVAAAYFVNYSAGTLPRAFIAIVYIASVAAVTADKFSSEIGVLDGEPVMLATFKRVKKGMSGGITALGLCASLLGSFIISASALYLSHALGLLAILTLCGFAGSIVDSLLGYWEEQGIGNKYTSNFVCAVAGVVVCIAFLVA